VAGNGNGGNDFDLVIIGGGPGGYVAAIRAAQLGMSVACVEKEKLGGVCLNIGCIPTKALLSSALLANELKDAEGHGIQADGMTFDLGPAQQRSRRVADQMNRGVHHLFKKYGPTHLEGHGRIAGKGTVEVEDGNGDKQTVRADHIIVATGSRPRNLPILEIDEEMIWSSTGALFQEKAPETLAVVGAGAVGMEFADIYEAYGSRVTILEALERVLPIEDEDCSKAVARSFEKRGMEVHTSARLESSEVGGDSVKLVFTDADGEEQTLEVERVLSAVGRVPNTEDVGLDTVGVERTEDGNFVAVDEWLRTNVDGIYAIGDCAGNQLLAHKASHEGIVCVEKIAGEAHHPVDYGNVPSCTYCHPEVASVGLTEAQAEDEGYDVEVGKFPFVGNGRAVAAGDADGFVKVVRDRRYSEVLGAHIVGPHATELIGEFVVGRHLETTAEEMEKAMHPHPTLSEAIAEGALASLGRPIHI